MNKKKAMNLSLFFESSLAYDRKRTRIAVNHLFYSILIELLLLTRYKIFTNDELDQNTSVEKIDGKVN